MNNRVTAIKNTCGIDIEVAGLLAPQAVVIPIEAAKFLLEQEQPEQCAIGDNALFCRWTDGRWMRAQVLATSFPDTVDRIIDSVGNDAPVEITSAWRDAYADASALSSGAIKITPSGLQGTRGAASGEIEAELSLSADHVSHWDVKVLDVVVPIAERWNPDAYPKPALFLGPGFRGLLAGVRS